MTTQVIEGTWEEITRQTRHLVGRKVRIFVLDDCEPTGPNQKALEIMQKVQSRQKDMQFTEGEAALDIINRGREGEMFD